MRHIGDVHDGGQIVVLHLDGGSEPFANIAASVGFRQTVHLQLLGAIWTRWVMWEGPGQVIDESAGFVDEYVAAGDCERWKIGVKYLPVTARPDVRLDCVR